jgi:hypothetical protein
MFVAQQQPLLPHLLPHLLPQLLQLHLDFMEEMKVCKICLSEKDLSYFNFHSSTKSYSRTCKECSNKIRREKWKENRILIGYKNVNSADKKFKICKICNKNKELIEENFSRKHRNNFYHTCKLCAIPRKKKRNLLSEEKEKIRNINIKDRPNRIFISYRKEDIRKGLNFSLTKEFIRENLSLPCFYCGFPSTGLDRIDNSKGHTIENCVPCCKECNIARNNNFSFEEMKIIGETIKLVKNSRQKC